MLNIAIELIELAKTMGDTAESSKDLQRTKANGRRMRATTALCVAEAEANLAKAKADRQRIEAECAARLKELEAERERINPMLKEMDELMATHPMSDEIRTRVLKLGTLLNMVSEKSYSR